MWLGYLGSSSCQPQNATTFKILESPIGCSPSEFFANAMQLVTCTTSGGGAAALNTLTAGVLMLCVAVLATTVW